MPGSGAISDRGLEAHAPVYSRSRVYSPVIGKAIGRSHTVGMPCAQMNRLEREDGLTNRSRAFTEELRCV